MQMGAFLLQKYQSAKTLCTSAVVIDLGITYFAITSDGDKKANPKYLKKSLKRLKLLQNHLSRKQKGSHNRDKARCDMQHFQFFKKIKIISVFLLTKQLNSCIIRA